MHWWNDSGRPQTATLTDQSNPADIRKQTSMQVCPQAYKLMLAQARVIRLMKAFVQVQGQSISGSLTKQPSPTLHDGHIKPTEMRLVLTRDLKSRIMRRSWCSQTMFFVATAILDAAASRTWVENCLTIADGLSDALPKRARLESCNEENQEFSFILPPCVALSLLLHSMHTHVSPSELDCWICWMLKLVLTNFS